MWRLILLLSFGVCGFAGGDLHAIEQDKVTHLSVAASAHSACTAFGSALSGHRLGPSLICFFFVNSLGVIKEAADPRFGGTRDPDDLAANLAGSGLSLVGIQILF